MHFVALYLWHCVVLLWPPILSVKTDAAVLNGSYRMSFGENKTAASVARIVYRKWVKFRLWVNYPFNSGQDLRQLLFLKGWMSEKEVDCIKQTVKPRHLGNSETLMPYWPADGSGHHISHKCNWSLDNLESIKHCSKAFKQASLQQKQRNETRRPPNAVKSLMVFSVSLVKTREHVFLSMKFNKVINV